MQVLDQSKAMEVIRAFSDEYSRKIILSIISRSLAVEEISKDQNIPISTCYRRVHELAKFGIIKAEKTILQEDGKKYVCYRSAFKSASIMLESGELQVDLIPNRDPTGKLQDMWSTVRSVGSFEGGRSTLKMESTTLITTAVPEGDCDICRAKGVPANIINIGDSNSTLVVCKNCEPRVKERK